MQGAFRFTGVSGLLTALVLLTGCASGGGSASAAAGAGATTSAPTPELAAQGRTLFAGAGTCGVCHGATGAGGRSGPNLTDDTWLWINPDSPTLFDDLVALIRSGIPQPRQAAVGMPAFGERLSEDQLRALASFVMSL